MLELCGLSEHRHIPVQVSQPLVDGRVPTSNVPNIRLEVLNIYCIKSNNGGVQSHIALCDLVAPVVWPWAALQVLLHAVQRLKQSKDVLLVRLLGCGKARFVDSVIDEIVHPAIRLLNLGAEVLREKYHVLILLGKDIIELAVEHADDIRRLVAHNLVLDSVVECWYREASGIVGVHLEVDLAEVGVLLVASNWIWPNILTRSILILRCSKSPT